MDDIAVIGVGLRFPGNATSPEELWKVLERGESQWTEFPKDRLNIDGYYHPGGDRQGSISFRGAHFLKGDLAAFDAPFFAVSADDAKAIDPQQRLLLEASYEALENAGIPKEDIEGSDTSVYVGSFVKDYEQICLRDPDWQPQYAATGNGIAIMANRISYAFNLHGPSMTIDTGCSGSLVSVHLAAQSLRNGESSLAIAAGAGMILTPNTIMPMTALNFLSPDGKCFTFDARANGYGRGEGIGVVILKRLSDALRDNDTIRAVIRGSKVNQDGRTTGITLPSKEAQVANIRSLYESAGLSFDQTAYVECHGTGTQAGDWRELKAISETLSTSRDVDHPIVVGSIKPNVGHLEGAAGVAGLIKGILVLEHGKIPPNINFEKGNPDIDFENWKIKVPTSLMDWPMPGVRRVSVNCFGFGGTNAHVIMDEAPAYLASRGLQGNHNSFDSALASMDSTMDAVSRPLLFCFASNEKSGVQRVINSHLPYLESIQNGLSPEFLVNYSYTLGCRRSKLEWKTVVVANSAEELISKMKIVDQNSFKRSSTEKQPRICFIFSGQGSQWAGMGKDLMSFTIFRQSLEAASAYMLIILGSPFYLIDEILKFESESRISDPEISQPATTAIQVAMVDLLASFSVTPRQVIGHSSGEIAAAYASGAISRESAWEVAYYRGLVAGSIAKKAPKLKGGMIAIGMSSQQAEDYLQPMHLSAQVACINSPRSVTVSGHANAIDFIANDLRQKEVFHRVLPVKTAYHSKHMKLVEFDYKSYLGHLATPVSSQGVKMFSSVTGQTLNGSELDGSYWAENMVSPVLYVAAVRKMMSLPVEERPSVIVELSPRAALQSPTADILADMDTKPCPSYYSVLDRKNDGTTSLLRVIGELWARSQHIDMERVITRGSRHSPLKCLAELPPYPWNHSKSYWHESHLGKANRFREYPRQDLIGAPTADSIPFEPRWRGFLRISENPWIQDHQVQKTIVYPAAGMISMVLEGAKQMAAGVGGLLGYEILNMKVEKAMIVPSTSHGLEMALNVRRDLEHLNDPQLLGSHEFSIYSKQLDSPWERHATGYLRFKYDYGDYHATLSPLNDTYQTLSESCCESLVPRQLYELLDTIGMNYGSLFQNIVGIRRGKNSCVSDIRIPDTKSKMPAKFEYPHLLHPATLDSMFQTLFAIEPVPMVPTFVESLFVSANIGGNSTGQFTGYSTANRFGVGGAKADISMQLDDGNSYVVVRGLHLTSIGSSAPEDGTFLPNHRNLCTEIVWNEDATFAKPARFVEFIELWAHKHPNLSVLQIGGSCTVTLVVLDTLVSTNNKTPRLSRYTIADTTGGNPLILKLVEGSVVAPYVEHKKVDGSEPLADYHLILVYENAGIDPEFLSKHLKAGGCILKVPSCDPLASPTSSSQCIKSRSFCSDELFAEMEDIRSQRSSVIESVHPLKIVLLHPDACGVDVLSFITHFKTSSVKYSALGVTVEEMSLGEVLSNTSTLAEKIVLSLLDFGEDKRQNGFFYGWTGPEFEMFHAMQAISKGVIWVTQGAHMESYNPKASSIIALARTLMSEDPLKTLATFDIGIESYLGSEEICLLAWLIFIQVFLHCANTCPRDLEFSEKHGKLYIPRLVTVDSLNRLIDNDDIQEGMAETPFCHDQLLRPDEPGLKLTITKPGLVDGGMYFTEFRRPNITRSEVEICFDRAALTFLDVDNASGRTRDPIVGLDIVGLVIGIGNDVTTVELGSDAVALVSGGSLQNTVVVDARFVTAARPGLIPSCFVSAYYALFHVGRAGPGHRVLVHAGASCFGLAAIQLCHMVGVEVFATVLGSESELQRMTLEHKGFSSDHIIDASSENFVSVVMQATSGRGVDVVYNPTQEHLELDVECIRRRGSIVQFENRSANRRVSRMIPSGGTIATFDLAQLLREDPDFVADLFHRTMTIIGDSPLDFMEVCAGLNREFEIGKLSDAFKLLEKAPYIGLVSIYGGYHGSLSVPVLPTDITKPLHKSIDPNGTYLLAGGLGGLGRSISELLVSNGARHLAFLSRSGASSDQAKFFIENLEKKGVTANVYCVDICDQEAMLNVVAGVIARDMPPIRGVFQCAAVIKDAVFDNMTYTDWMTAVRPKTVGSWNLVESINSVSHDPFFIFLASSAGVIGNRGQANYAAGNCAEDALARFLRLSGKHAVSIDLGPVLGAGMLAEDEEILDMLRASGFYGIRHEDFIKVVKHAITMETLPGTPMPAQVTLGVGTGGLILQNQPADPYWSRTALYSYLNLVDMPPPDLSRDATTLSKDIKSTLARCADRTSAAEIVCNGLMHMLAKAMNLLFEEMDAGKPPNAYGVDSLVAVGVRNWVLSSCSVQVSVFDVLSDKTVSELAMVVAEKGGFGESKG